MYPEGIVAILKYFKRKMQRAEFREKIVKALKEQVYHTTSIDDIQEAFQMVMDNLKVFFFKTEQFRTLMSIR